MKILLIGFGGIGKRHYESLIKDIKNSVYISDLNLDFDIHETYTSRTYKVHNILSLTGESFDLLILATNANIRAQMIEDLLSNINVKKIIIEKPISQSICGLKVLKEIDKNIPIYVNFPQRYYPIYKNLKELCIKCDFNLNVSGYNLGMACNIWHYVDLVQYITESTIENVEWSNVEWIPSKRLGFEEIDGECYIQFTNNIHLNLSTSLNKEDPLIIRIQGPEKLDLIIENYHFMSSSINGFSSGDQVDVYQSNLTLEYLNDASIKIPRLSDVYDSTLNVLRSILMLKYKQFNDETRLPIT